MTTGKALNGKVMTRPQVASRSEVARGLRASVCAATPRRGSLLYIAIMLAAAICNAEVCPERQNDKMPGDPAAADGGMELLVSRYADAAAAEQDVSRAAGLRTALKANGSWGDIDYFDRKSSEWRAGAHVRARLCILAADWRRKQQPVRK